MADIPTEDRSKHHPLRIAMVVPPWYELPPPGYGGLEQVCAELVDGLVARGHEVTLFGAGIQTGTAAEFVSTVNETQHERLGQTMPELLHVARVNQLINEGAFDVVHDHTVIGMLTAADRQVPTVATVHGPPIGELGEYLGCLDASVGLVAISRSQRRQNPDLPWTATIHHGLGAPDPDRTLRRRTSGIGPVLWMARFAPEKGPDLAVRACRVAGLPLVLAGKCNEPGEQRYLREEIAPLVGPDVEVVLNADRVRCQKLLREARCLLLPIRWEEPFGMVMLEAMAAGTPVVALNRGAVPEVVHHRETGLICDDPGDLPGALHEVLGLDPAACVAHVRRFFPPGLMAYRYEQVFRRRIAPAVTGHTNPTPSARSPWVSRDRRTDSAAPPAPDPAA